MDLRDRGGAERLGVDPREHGAERAPQLVRLEAEAGEHGFGAVLDAVRLVRQEPGLHPFQGVQEPVVPLGRVVRLGRHLGCEPLDLGFEREHGGKGPHRRVEHGLLARHLLHVLLQVSQGRPAADGHRARVGGHPPVDHLEEGRLAGAIRPDEADALARLDRPGQPVEHLLPAERQ